MGSSQTEAENHIFLQNRSGIRVRATDLRNFAAELRRKLKLKGAVAVLICNDREIRAMNKAFRGKDKATDVLSFPSEIRGHAGDLAISAETASRNARGLKLSLNDEMKILVLHGMLHLAGFDHETDRGEMANLEAVIRRRFGLPDGLIERAYAPVKARTKR
jgi:probable rRNA maturation factor